MDPPVNEEGIVKGGDSVCKKSISNAPLYCEVNRNKIPKFTKVSEVGLSCLKSATLMQLENYTDLGVEQHNS